MNLLPFSIYEPQIVQSRAYSCTDNAILAYVLPMLYVRLPVRADHSSRGVLPIVVCPLIVIAKPHGGGGRDPESGRSATGKKACQTSQRRMMNSNLGKTWKGVVVAYSEQVLQYLLEGTEETRKTWARRLCVPAEFRTGNVPNKATPVRLLAQYGYRCIGPLGDACVSQYPPNKRLCALYTLSEPMSVLHFRPAEPPERKQALP
jgi:hypothetical protein